MAKQTYRIQSERNMTYCSDIPINVVTGHPYQKDLTAGLALFNRVGSNRIVKVMDVGVNRYSSNSSQLNAATEPNTWYGIVTTNNTGSDILTPKPLDSNATSIPSQVVCSENIRPTTDYSPNRLRRLRSLPMVINTVALSAFLQKGSGMLNYAGHFSLDSTTAEMQRLTVRENEGFAVVCSEPSNIALDVANIYDIVVTFKIGANTFQLYSDKGAVAQQIETTHAFTLQIWNGTGSGVTIEIVDVHYLDCGEQNPVLVEDTRVETISSLNLNGSDPCVFLSRDSRNETLTGRVDYATNVRVHLTGDKTGALIQRNFFRRFVMVGDTMRVGVAPLGNFLPFGGDEGNFTERPIVLNEGEGIAVFDRNTVTIGRRRRYIQFTVENKPVPSQPSFNIGI